MAKRPFPYDPGVIFVGLLYAGFGIVQLFAMRNLFTTLPSCQYLGGTRPPDPTSGIEAIVHLIVTIGIMIYLLRNHLPFMKGETPPKLLLYIIILLILATTWLTVILHSTHSALLCPL